MNGSIDFQTEQIAVLVEHSQSLHDQSDDLLRRSARASSELMTLSRDSNALVIYCRTLTEQMGRPPIAPPHGEISGD